MFSFIVLEKVNSVLLDWPVSSSCLPVDFYTRQSNSRWPISIQTYLIQSQWSKCTSYHVNSTCRSLYIYALTSLWPHTLQLKISCWCKWYCLHLRSIRIDCQEKIWLSLCLMNDGSCTFSPTRMAQMYGISKVIDTLWNHDLEQLQKITHLDWIEH